MFGRVQKGEPFLKTGTTFGNQLMEKTWQVLAYGENRMKKRELLIVLVNTLQDGHIYLQLF